MKARYLLLLTLVAGASACDKHDPVVEYCGDVAVGEGITYLDLYGFFEVSCLGCHATTRTGDQREGAPVGLDYDYCEVAVETGEQARDSIQAGTMPPHGSATKEQKLLFQGWVDSGMPCSPKDL